MNPAIREAAVRLLYIMHAVSRDHADDVGRSVRGFVDDGGERSNQPRRLVGDLQRAFQTVVKDWQPSHAFPLALSCAYRLFWERPRPKDYSPPANQSEWTYLQNLLVLALEIAQPSGSFESAEPTFLSGLTDDEKNCATMRLIRFFTLLDRLSKKYVERENSV